MPFRVRPDMLEISLSHVGDSQRFARIVAPGPGTDGVEDLFILEVGVGDARRGKPGVQGEGEHAVVV